MKRILLLLLILGGAPVACQESHAQTTNAPVAITNLVMDPNPPARHATPVPLLEVQFDAIIAAGPTLNAGETAAMVQSFSITGLRLTIGFTDGTWQHVTLTSGVLATIVAAGPTPPTGKTTPLAYTAARSPDQTMITLSAWF